MNTKDYIESGILELYVYGALTEKETAQVTETLSAYPELKQEVEVIEQAVAKLSTAVAPYNPEALLQQIKDKLNFSGDKVRTLPKRKTNTAAIIGWAASIALLGGLFFMLSENNSLREDLRYEQTQNAIVKGKFDDANKQLSQTQDILATLRNKDVVKIDLGAQAVAKDAYAAVYWDVDGTTAYIDAQGLPKPPKGKVYQVWSLKLEPLTPTSIGLLENLTADIDNLYKFENGNASEAFGITLEPAGGSDTPTLEQLYVLGIVGQ